MKAFSLNRKVYKDIKKKDHQQMNDFMVSVYTSGFEDGVRHTKINYVALKEILLSVKGIGEVKADTVIERLKELDKE